MNKPVILLAFANEREEGQRYLRNLPLEMNRLRATLEKAEDKGLCELAILPNTTLDNLLGTFQREKYRNRIAIFHYGGHAGSYELLLEQASGKNEIAHGEGLIPFLAGQKGLQLVFLNGCHSARQAEELLKNRIPAVVGTVSAVDDHIATELASAFYQALGEGMALGQAWQEATFKIRASEGAHSLNRYYQQAGPPQSSRDMVLPLDEPRDQFPWQIHFREGAEAARDWNLPDAANDPYFGLPDIPARYGFPEEPYRFLERYTKEDARIFFGRGSYIRDLYHRIHSPQAAPAILLYGQSGVGKSSLLEAGLFPRLEEEYDIRLFRRQPETGLLGHLMEALELPAGEADATKLRQQWRQLETQSKKKGIVIVLDQVEEVFTRPAEGQPEELNDFLQTASAIFARPDERPIGKLVLSYRKEYDPEIEKACRIAALPKEKAFLERLDRKGILEIAGGLGSNPQLQNKYRLQIEKGLPVLIADDLLEDRNSPIAPVLQIILTKLWQLQEDQDKRIFRAEDYQKLKKEGILLDDFFQQQMAQVRAWEEQIQQKVESSGLALDVLHYHTTALGTAESRDLETLRTHYQHQSDVLQQLLQQLQSLYLLAGLGPQQTALAHDTLAPIVQKEIRDSDKPGQRALRILMAKMADYDISPERTYIDEEDLALVEAGAGGMRMWTMKEKELVEKSRERRAKLQAGRKRNRQLKIIGVLTIAILAMVASIFGVRAQREAKTNRLRAQANSLVSKALRLEKSDATQALMAVNEALSILPEDEGALQARHDIYSENEFYRLVLEHDTAVGCIDLSAGGRLILTANGRNACLWDSSGALLETFPHDSPIRSVAFSPDEKLVLTSGDSRKIMLWNRAGQPFLQLSAEMDSIVAIFSPKGEYVLGGGTNGLLTLWSAQDGKKIFQHQAHDTLISSLAFAPDGASILTGGLDGTARLWRLEGNQIRQAIAPLRHPARVLTVAISPDGKTLLTGARDGIARLWNLDGSLRRELMGHRKRINDAIFSPDGQFILTASNDQAVNLWSRDGELIQVYRGHDNFVNAIAFSPEASVMYFASAGQDKTAKLWKQESKLSHSLGHFDNGVECVAFSPDGETVIAGLGTPPYDFLDLANEAAAQSNFWVLLWRPAEQHIDTLRGHIDNVNAVAASPDGDCYLSGSEDGTAILWSKSGQRLTTFKIGIPIDDVAFSPASTNELAIVDALGNVTLWNSDGTPTGDTLSYSDWVPDLAFSPDGSEILTACADGSAYFWKGGEPFRQISRGNIMTAVAYSDDGRYFALGEGGETAALSIWKADDANRPLYPPIYINSDNKTGARGIRNISFSPDGQYLLAGLEGGTAKAFRVQDGQEIFSFQDASGLGVQAQFSPKPERAEILIGSRGGWAGLLPNPVYQEFPTIKTGRVAPQ